MFVRLGLLGIALTMTFVLALGITGALGWDSLPCQLAFVIVFGCSMASLMIGEFPRGDEFVILRLGSSMFLRSGILLVVLMLLTSQEESGRALLDNGFIHYIFAFYSIGLFFDVWLTCLRTKNPKLTELAQESYSSQPEY